MLNHSKFRAKWSPVQRLLCFAVTFFLGAGASAQDSFYVVKKDDTFATILQGLGMKVSWGANGTVAKIVRTNTFLRERGSADLIYPGEKIALGAEIALQTAKGRELLSAVATPIRTAASEDPPAQTVLESQEPRQQLAPERKEASYSQLGLNLRYSFSSFDSVDSSNDSHARLLSDPTFGFEVGWKQVWSQTWQSKFDIFLDNATLRDPGSGQLKTTSLQFGGGEFAVGYTPPIFETHFVFRQAQEVFIHADVIGTATAEPVPRTRVGIILKKKVLSKDDLGLALLGGALLGLPTTTGRFSIDFDSRYVAGFEISHEFETKQLNLQLRYESCDGRTSVSKTADQEIKALVGITFNLSRERAK